jgi:hypothetical protein
MFSCCALMVAIKRFLFLHSAGGRTARALCVACL